MIYKVTLRRNSQNCDIFMRFKHFTIQILSERLRERRVIFLTSNSSLEMKNAKQALTKSEISSSYSAHRYYHIYRSLIEIKVN